MSKTPKKPKKYGGKFKKGRRKELAKQFQTSDDKIEHFANIFEELDQGKKGAWDPATLVKAATKLGFALTSAQADKMLKMYKVAKKVGGPFFDIDKFVVLMLRKMKWGKKETQSDAAKLFKSFDKNGDGYLSAKELRQGMEKLGDPMTDEEAEELMKMADTDKDGRVSYEEFLELWKQLFG